MATTKMQARTRKAAVAPAPPLPPLVLDLDRTLIRTDLLHESVFAFLKHNPFGVFLMLLWALKGRAYLKQRLARAVTIDVDDMMDWGLLGYYVGEIVQEHKPVLSGRLHHPNLIKLKHFGAAAASSGGVEMYHIPGVTPEARTMEEAFGPHRPQQVLHFGEVERREAWEKLQSATDRRVDFIMLGCPHNAIEQVELVAHLLRGRKIHPDVALWVHTPRAIKEIARRAGYLATIEAAGGVIMSDTCPAISRRLPEGVRVIATDSAKQAHYLPAIAKLQGWFGSVRQCVDAALTGEWQGGL